MSHTRLGQGRGFITDPVTNYRKEGIDAASFRDASTWGPARLLRAMRQKPSPVLAHIGI